MDWFIDKGIRIIIIIAAAIIIYLICRVAIPSIMKRIVTQRMVGADDTEVQNRTKTLSSILVSAAGIVIAAVAVITILPEFGVEIAALIAGIGIGGLAIAFAAQNLVRDFITGFFIILEDQYRINDIVSIAGATGTVETIGLRRTVLRDVDGNVHSIPNGKVEISTNMTRQYSRVNLNVSVGYGENLKQVINVINGICREMAEDPQWKNHFVSVPSVLRVDKLGDSGIELKIFGDTKPAMQWAIMGELRYRLKNTFDKEGIEAPWPRTKVYLGNTPDFIKHN